MTTPLESYHQYGDSVTLKTSANWDNEISDALMSPVNNTDYYCGTGDHTKGVHPQHVRLRSRWESPNPQQPNATWECIPGCPEKNPINITMRSNGEKCTHNYMDPANPNLGDAEWPFCTLGKDVSMCEPAAATCSTSKKCTSPGPPSPGPPPPGPPPPGPPPPGPPPPGPASTIYYKCNSDNKCIEDTSGSQQNPNDRNCGTGCVPPGTPLRTWVIVIVIALAVVLACLLFVHGYSTHRPTSRLGGNGRTPLHSSVPLHSSIPLHSPLPTPHSALHTPHSSLLRPGPTA